MKPRAQELVIDDRISTREELGEVIGLLITLHQLPFEATLESLESSESRSEVEGPELWTDADGDRRQGVEIERLPTSFLAADTSLTEVQNGAYGLHTRNPVIGERDETNGDSHGDVPARKL